MPGHNLPSNFPFNSNMPLHQIHSQISDIGFHKIHSKLVIKLKLYYTMFTPRHFPSALTNFVQFPNCFLCPHRSRPQTGPSSLRPRCCRPPSSSSPRAPPSSSSLVCLSRTLLRYCGFAVFRRVILTLFTLILRNY